MIRNLFGTVLLAAVFSACQWQGGVSTAVPLPTGTPSATIAPSLAPSRSPGSATPSPTAIPPLTLWLPSPLDSNNAAPNHIQQVLEEETGARWQVQLTSDCQSVDSAGILPSGCEEGAAYLAARGGTTWRATAFIVPIRSLAQQLTDLNQTRWAVGDFGNTGEVAAFLGFLNESGVEPAEWIETGSTSLSLQAILLGNADFTTVAYLPPMADSWEIGMAWEPEDRANCLPTGLGATCAGWEVRDGRVAALNDVPNVFSQTRIVAVTEPIFNESLHFGAALSPALREQVFAALQTAFESCGEACAAAGYDWQEWRIP